MTNGRKLLKIVGIALVAIALVFYGAMNAFLVSKKVTQLVSEGDGEGFNLSYSNAYSLFPGRVELRDLRIWGVDANLNWEVRIDRATLKIDLRKLPSRILSVRNLWARGVQIRVRNHLPEEAEEIRARIAGKATQSAREKPNPREPWQLNLDGIDLQEVRTAQFNEFRFEGDSAMRGHLFLQPGTRLEIGGGGWDVREGAWFRLPDGVALADRVKPFLDDFRLRVGFDLKSTDLKEVKGSKIFPAISAHLQASGRTTSAALLALFFPNYRTLQFGQVNGRFQTEIHIENGVIQPGTRGELDLKEVDFGLIGLRVQGVGKFLAEVRGDRKFALDFGVRNLRGRVVEGPNAAPVIQGGAVRFQGNSSRLTLNAQPFSDMRLEFTAQDLLLRNFEELIAHFSGATKNGVPLKGESGVLNATAKIDPARDTTELNVKLVSPALTYLKMTKDKIDAKLTTGITVLGKLTSQRFSQRKFSVGDLRVSLSDLGWERTGEKDAFRKPDWHASFKLAKAELQFGDPFKFRGDFNLALSNLQMPVRFLTQPSFWVSLGTSLFPMDALEGGGTLALDRQRVTVDGLDLRSGNQRIAGFIHQGKLNTAGRVYLRLLPLPLCYRLEGPEDSGIGVVLSESACLGERRIAQ